MHGLQHEDFCRLNFQAEIVELKPVAFLSPELILQSTFASFVQESDQSRFNEIFALIRDEGLSQFQAVFRFRVRYGETVYLHCILQREQNQTVQVLAADVSELLEGSYGLLSSLDEQYSNELKTTEAMLQIQNHYLRSMDGDGGFSLAIQHLVEITDSKFGFFADLNNESSNRFLRILSAYQQEQQGEHREFLQQVQISVVEFHDFNNLFGQAIATEGFQIRNFIPAGDLKLPLQHPPIEHFLGIPLFFESQVIGLVALANRSGGYDKRLLWQFSRLFEQASLLLHAYRENQKRMATERRLLEAQEIGGLGTWLFSMQQKQLIWSKEMFRIFGRESSMGEPSLDEHLQMIHPEDMPEWQRATQKVFITGESSRIVFRIMKNDGQIAYIEGVAKAQYHGDKVVTIHGTCRDVTDKVKAEQDLEIERAKLIQASKMSSLGEMASGIAHEINNPMSIIVGYNSKVRKQLKQEPIDVNALLSVTDKIDIAVKRVTRIIEGLRNFSRDGSYGPKEIFSLAEVVDDALALSENRLKNLAIEFNLEGAVHAKILAARIPVSQILLNLINNSIDAIADMPSRWIRIECSASSDQDLVRIRHIDSGHGIAKEVQDKILQPFFTTKAVGKGTGLGLSISKGIAESQGGSLWIDSEHPHTCFVLELPNAFVDRKVA